MDEVKLGLARESARDRDLGNIEFRSANVNEWDEPDTYDFVYSRFLLQHLSRPVDLLRKMWSAVRRGGAIAVEDADFDCLFCYPPNEGYAFWADTYRRVLARSGGDPQLGRKLHAHFLDVGIPKPSMNLLQHSSITGEVKTLPLSTLEATAGAIVAEGIATEAEVAAAVASLAEFARDPRTIVCGPSIFQVWARRE
jgi:SAM-dependent methyltransferase